MYIKVDRENIQKYPYSIEELRKDNPETSFPEVPSSALLAEWGVYSVAPTEKPSINENQKLEEGEPLNDNGWKQTWVILEKTLDDAEIEKQLKSENIRSKRDQLLAASDWTQVADAPVDKGVWAQYRQQLRDVPQQENFPLTVLWPIEPK